MLRLHRCEGDARALSSVVISMGIVWPGLPPTVPEPTLLPPALLLLLAKVLAEPIIESPALSTDAVISL